MADENDIEIRVEVDDSQATAKLTDLDGKVRDVGLSANETAGGFSRFEAAIVTASSAVNLAAVAFGAITGAASSLFSIIERGSAIDDVASAFENLTTKAGGLSDVFLNDLKAATGETISSFELMQKANQALQAGIKPDQYVALTQAARALAEETGGNLTEELSKLERAFATGQDRLLKNRLGIIDLEKAQQSLAENLGTTIDKLTEEQKTFAARNAIVDAAKKKTQDFGVIEADAGDKIARVGAILADYRDRLFRTIGTSESVVKLLGLLVSQFERLNPVIEITIKVFTALDEAISKTITFLEDVSEKVGGFQSVLEKMVRTIPPVAVGMDILGAATSYFSEEAEQLEGVVSEVSKATEELTSATSERTGGLAAALGEVQKKVSDLNSASGLPSLGDSVKDAVEAVAEAPKVFDFTAALSESLASGIKNALNSGSLRDAFKGFASVFGASIGGSLGKVVETSIIPSLTSILGASIGGPAGAVGGQLFGGWVENAINDFAAAVESGDFGGIAEGLVDSIFPGFGGFANDIVDSLFGGGDSAGTEAKKSADKFFADIFDANRVAVVIDGKLTEISDLVFSGNQDGGLFSSLPGATQAAFAGIGTAFEGLLGIAGDLGVNIGNVFANNLGGSLNNLQILVQQTGISFDQLRDQVVKAFLDGKLSATQAAEALKGIEQISQKGIPDALGAVDQAFQNLIDSGTNGGAALVDALGDIAAEATELSITSLDKVREFLTQSGKFTEAQISQIFAALASNGIDSIDELTNVTAEQAIQIVAALESAGFAFSETGSAVTNIAEELNNIPSEINTIVRVRYVAEGDSAAAEAVGQKIQDVTSTFTPSGEGISTTSSASSGSSSRRPVGGLA